MHVFFCPSVDQAPALLEPLEYPAVKLPNRDLVLGARTALRAHLLAFFCVGLVGQGYNRMLRP